ncbi:hypothetical protein U1Q18_048991, partial [Sarracenia purpurea var. burkii]
ESVGETNMDESNGSISDLGRRSKIVLGKLGDSLKKSHDPHPESIGLDLDSSGLGIFDAFFASVTRAEDAPSLAISPPPPTGELGFNSTSAEDAGPSSLGKTWESFPVHRIGGDGERPPPASSALMAMRHPKSIVLSGALSALFVMTVLSTGLGRIVPNLISRKHTNSAATVAAEGRGGGESTGEKRRGDGGRGERWLWMERRVAVDKEVAKLEDGKEARDSYKEMTD